MLYVHFFIALSSFFIYEILQVKYNKNILSYNCSIHIKILNSIIKLQLNNHKSVKKNSFKYILRLLAGKFGRICTEFPLTTFSSQDSLEFFRQNSCNHLLVQFFLQATFWIAFGFNFCTTFDQILVHLLQILRKDFLSE